MFSSFKIVKLPVNHDINIDGNAALINMQYDMYYFNLMVVTQKELIYGENIDSMELKFYDDASKKETKSVVIKINNKIDTSSDPNSANRVKDENISTVVDVSDILLEFNDSTDRIKIVSKSNNFNFLVDGVVLNKEVYSYFEIKKLLIETTNFGGDELIYFHYLPGNHEKFGTASYKYSLNILALGKIKSQLDKKYVDGLITDQEISVRIYDGQIEKVCNFTCVITGGLFTENSENKVTIDGNTYQSNQSVIFDSKVLNSLGELDIPITIHRNNTSLTSRTCEIQITLNSIDENTDLVDPLNNTLTITHLSS